ncbi:26311_t:CDS:2, partial [Racocetra persica]
VKDNENNMHNKHMTDDEITGLILDVVAGGVETTPSAICYIIYYIEHHPEVKQRMLNELDQTFGPDSDYKIELDDINQLKYCEAVIKEVINSHPAHWTNPHEFKPERFLQTVSDSSSIDSRKSNQYFQAFGGGLKICPGKNFAMMQMKTYMVLLYRRWTVELIDMSAPIKSHYATTKSCQQLE